MKDCPPQPITHEIKEWQKGEDRGVPKETRACLARLVNSAMCRKTDTAEVRGGNEKNDESNI